MNATLTVNVNIDPTGPNAHMDEAEQTALANALADVLDAHVAGAEVTVNA